jgi:UDP-glucose 4-epimerase
MAICKDSRKWCPEEEAISSGFPKSGTQMHKEKLNGKSILVTGGAGFIGSHLVARLLEDNDVTVLDNFSSGKKDYILPHLENPRFHLLQADMLDAGAIKEALKKKDFVFHLAANAEVKLGAEDTRVHLEQNILATYNLLEAMRKTGVRQIAFTSTSTVYGDATIVPTPEDYGPLLPISLYGASKLSCEALISSYCHTFEMQSWIFRFANIVGERGTHGVIVDFIRKLRANNKELEILGSGKQKKSYLEVKDCVEAMLHCVEHSDDETNVFNIGSIDYVDVSRIADIVTMQMGLSGVKYRYTGGIDGRGWKGDVKVMQLSIEKIKAIGWIPQRSSADAIEFTVKALLYP